MKWIVGLIQKYKPILILVFIPIGFTLLFGGAMSPIFVEDIPIVILDLDESDASREIVDEFRACPVFQIVDAASSAEEIREEILMGTIKGGLVLPDGFGKSIGAHKGTKALMLMDGSNFLVGNNLMLYANKIFTARNSELQISYLEAGGVAAYASEQSLDTLALVDRNEIKGAKFAVEVHKVLLDNLESRYPTNSSTYMKEQVALLSAEKAAKDAPVQIEIDIRNKAAELEDKKAALEAAKAVKTYAEEGCRLICISYESGMSTLAELQAAQGNVYKAGLAVAAAISDYDLTVQAFGYAEDVGIQRLPL